MRIRATIDRFDLLRLNLYLFPRLKANWILVAVIAIVGFVYLTLNHDGPLSTHALLVILGSALAGGLGGLLAGFLVCLMFLLLPSGQRDGVLGEHEYEIREDGLFERTNANESLNKWNGIRSVVLAGNAIYIGLSGYLYFIIPRRAFATYETFREYYDALNKHWRTVT